MTAPERSLATVLFTDIVGSTERAAELRDAGWRELRQQHDQRVRREIRRFGGREINTAGDSFLTTFQRPAQAIACADAIRAAVRELGLEVRAGLHMGELEGAGRELGGLAINIGARVAAEAAPGEILVSRPVRDVLAGSAFDFEDRGVRTLKGVPGEWRLFAVTGVLEVSSEALAPWSRTLLRPRTLVAGTVVGALLVGLAALYVSRRDGVLALSPEQVLAADAAPGIAVLPFTVNDPALETWREGMVDLLSINLDGVPGLRPIASRTVMARWREEVEGMPDLAATLEVARRTGALYALIGNAVSIGPEVRFAADIYDTRTGEHLGSASAEGSPDSVFAVVDRLSIEIVRALPQGEEGVLPNLDLASVTTTSLPALKSYLEGESAYRGADFKRAVAAFQRAVEADSFFAGALMQLGAAKAWRGDVEISPRLAALVDRLPERDALIVRANLLLNGDSLRTKHRGVEMLREASQKYPDDPDVWYMLGEAIHHGRSWTPVTPKEGEEAFSRAITLDRTYGPAYHHLIESAFGRGDSVRCAELMPAYARLVPDSLNFFAASYQLGFGEPASNPAIRKALLDSMPDLGWPMWHLLHPRFEATQREVLARLRDAVRLRFHEGVVWGDLETARDVLEDPSTEDGLRARGLYFFHLWGFPVSWERLEKGLALGPLAPEIDWERAFFAGAYAAEQGRWDDHAEAVSRIRVFGSTLDDSDSLRIESMARTLEGYGLLRRGRREAGLRRIEEGQGLALPYAPPTGGGGGADRAVSWWLGTLYLEMDRPRDALPHFEKFWPEPLGAYQLGKVYEALNDHVKAREMYAFVVEYWRDADPALQPIVREAHQHNLRLERE